MLAGLYQAVLRAKSYFGRYSDHLRGGERRIRL